MTDCVWALLEKRGIPFSRFQGRWVAPRRRMPPSSTPAGALLLWSLEKFPQVSKDIVACGVSPDGLVEGASLFVRLAHRCREGKASPRLLHHLWDLGVDPSRPLQMGALALPGHPGVAPTPLMVLLAWCPQMAMAMVESGAKTMDVPGMTLDDAVAIAVREGRISRDGAAALVARSRLAATLPVAPPGPARVRL